MKVGGKTAFERPIVAIILAVSLLWAAHAQALGLFSRQVAGKCGPANGTYKVGMPTTGLCSVGLANDISKSGPPWTWECVGRDGGSTAQCSTLAAPAASHVWTPVGAGWTLTFDDEFNGSAVDTNRWQVPDGSPDNTYPTYSNAVWQAANVSVAGGFAHLSVTKKGSGYGTAGMTSYFMQTYGYWEARVKAPCNADGIGADFWTDAAGWNFPEIDMLEWLGITPTTDYTTWHYAYPQDGTNPVGISSSTGGINFCGAFHVIGMWWQPTGITWYIDGLLADQTAVYVDLQNAIPQWIILDATVGGFNINYIDATTVFPATYQVDYVHVYSNSPTAVAVAPDAGYGGPGDSVGSGN